MKKILLFANLLLISGLSSCVKEREVTPEIFPGNGLITMTRSLDIQTRSGDEATLTAVFDINDESLVEYSISPEFLEAVQMTAEEFDRYLKEKMGSLYYLQSDNVATRGAHADCIKDCYATLEKGNGRGACKAGCWVDSVIRLAEAVAEAFVNVFIG